MDVIELNEAFAAQGLAVLRDLGLADDDARVNPNGGAIALGHPLGASGARLVTTAVNQLHRSGGPLRAVHDVHRRRPGHRAGGRTGLMDHPRSGLRRSPSRGPSLDTAGPVDLACLARSRATAPGAACKAHQRTGKAGSAVFA